MAAAPANHRVVLENAHVRVLDVTVQPGEREKVHAHCRKSVMYLVQEGAYRDYDAVGKLIEEVTVAPPASRFPMTLWLEPQGPHAVHNLDSRPTRLLRIELKDDAPRTAASPCPWPAKLDAVAAAPGHHKVLLENERVRVLDVTVAPGEKEPLHAHCRPSVMHVSFVGKARDYDEKGKVFDEATVSPPESDFPQTFWLESSPPHAVENLDPRPIRLLRIELKR